MTVYHRYNLETCTERRITYDQHPMQKQSGLWNGRLVCSSEVSTETATLVQYDIHQNTFENLPVVARGISALGFAAHWVAYADTKDPALQAIFYWRLRDMETGLSTSLESTHEGAASGGDLSEQLFT